MLIEDVRLTCYDVHMGMQGKKHSEETKARMREAARRRIKEHPHTLPDNTGNQNFLGKTHTPEAREKIRQAKLGAKNPMFGIKNEDHPSWKGDAVGYYGIHDWLTSNFGQPKQCELCGTDDPSKRYEWANLSGEYKRDRADFMRMCKKCHNNFDGVNVQQQRTKV